MSFRSGRIFDNYDKNSQNIQQIKLIFTILSSSFTIKLSFLGVQPSLCTSLDYSIIFNCPALVVDISPQSIPIATSSFKVRAREKIIKGIPIWNQFLANLQLACLSSQTHSHNK